MPYFSLALHLGPSEFVRRGPCIAHAPHTRRCTSGVDAAVRAARPHVCPEEALVPAGSAIRARHVRVALTSTSTDGSPRPSPLAPRSSSSSSSGAAFRARAGSGTRFGLGLGLGPARTGRVAMAHSGARTSVSAGVWRGDAVTRTRRAAERWGPRRRSASLCRLWRAEEH